MSFCTADVPDHDNVLCEDYLNGGIDAFALIQCNVELSDYEDEAVWVAAEAAGTVLVFRGLGIKAEFPDASAAKVDNPSGCGAAQILAGMDFTFTWTDANSTSTNDTVYSGINGRNFKLAWRECQNGIIKVTTECVTITVTPVKVPGSNKEIQMYAGSAEWSGGKSSHPVRYDEPGDFFDPI